MYMYMDIVLASLHVYLETSSHLSRLLVIRRYQLRQNICQTKPRRRKIKPKKQTPTVELREWEWFHFPAMIEPPSVWQHSGAAP